MYEPHNRQQDHLNQLFRMVGGDFVSFRAEWARRLKSIPTALVLQHLLFVGQVHADEDGWFFVTADAMYEATCVGRDAYRTARTTLTSLDLIETERRGTPAKTWVRFKTGNLERWITSDGRNQDCGNPQSRLRELANKTADTRNLYTRNTDKKENKKSTRASREPLESGSTTTSGSNKASGQPHVAILEEWLGCIGVAELPPRGDRLWSMARNAEKGGLLPEEVRPIYEWLTKHDRNGFWKANGISPANLLSNKPRWISVGRPGLEKVVPIEGGPEAELRAVRGANTRTIHDSFDDRVVKLKNILDACVRLGVVPNEDELVEAYNYWVQGLIDPAGYPFLLEYDPMRSES